MIWDVDGLKLLDQEWVERLEPIDYAFQPIVNIHTGKTFAFEALLRGHQDAGFSCIDAVFDLAYEQGQLHQVDMALRKKALEKFSRFRKKYPAKLFYNLDNRLFNSRDYAPGSTGAFLDALGYSRSDLCFEVSEKHPFKDNQDAANILKTYRDQGFKIAVDDCGTGFAGLQLLYYTEPDYIKIDRFFIQNMGNDPKKRLVVSTIVNFAHFMGSLVMAEGVETRDEYFQCKAIGCDMVQGYLIQKPATDMGRLKSRYRIIHELSLMERRHGRHKDSSLISGEIEAIKPVSSIASMTEIVHRFRKEEQTRFFPVVTPDGEPAGIIRDVSIKEYIFSKFGHQLLENPAFGRDVSRFVSKIPVADIHSSVEQLIETYTHFNNNEGLIMVDDMSYVGLISTKSLLKLIHEKNLIQARNQNPLSRLPGNTMIHEYISKSLTDMAATYFLVYFDFDNFKPFNDKYGFRNGDRLILMFADLLRSEGVPDNCFVGHVGGDDFFMGIRQGERSAVIRQMQTLSRTFKRNAESFYDKDALENRQILSKDREGNVKAFPLISVSVAVLELPIHMDRACTIEDAGNIMALLKKEAKQSSAGLAHASIMEFLCMGVKNDPAGIGRFFFELHPDPCRDLNLV